MMPVRRLVPTDLDAWLATRAEALRAAPKAFASAPEHDRGSDRAHIAALLEAGTSGDALFGAFDGSELVGVLGFHREQGPKLRHKAVLWGIYVKKAARGKRLGARLIEAAIAHARTDDSLKDLQLGVGADNVAAKRVYEQMGFVAWGTEPRAMIVDGEACDEIYMRFALDQ